MKQIRIFSKGLRVWIRDFHCYFGLFISPLILIFALTAILFNHKLKTNNATSDIKIEKASASVNIPTDLEGLAQAKQIMRQLDISGEVVITRYLPKQNRLTIVVTKPGRRININVDLKEQALI